MTSTRGRPRYDDILTPREWQVVDLLEQGLTNEEIAESLQISFGGAKFHVAEIISKLGAEDRHDALRLARGKQHARAGLLGWILSRLRFAAQKPILVGSAAVALVASILLLGALLTNRLAWPASGPNEADLGQALADFERGGSQHDFLAQAQFDPDGCVTGEEARNPRSPSGIVMPLRRSFNAIEEGERFLCLPLPRPRTSELRLRPGDAGWRSSSGDRIDLPVATLRSHDLETSLDPANGGKGGRMATIRYLPSRGAGPEVEFEVWLGGPPRVSSMETAQTVTLQDVEGELFRIPNAYGYPDSVVVRWAKNGYGFIASTDWLDDFVLDEFLAILETVS